MFQRIGSLIVKEFIQLRRDLLFVILILLGPASELTAVAYATGTEIRNLPTAIYDYDRSPESRELAQMIANVETFNVIDGGTDLHDATEMLDRGEVYMVIVIPPRFSDGLHAPTTRPQVQVILNGAESAAAGKALEAIEGTINRYSTDIVLELSAFPSLESLEPSARVWFNEELRQANYTIPSELGFMLYVVALWVAALGFSRERELGTLEQLLVSPLSRFELIMGKSIPAVIIGYFNFLLMLAMTVFLFKVPMRGSLPLLLVLAFFYILVELQRGLLISLLSETQQQALLTVFMLAFVDMTFSGYAVPVESMPLIFQKIAFIFPIRHWMIIMRGIMLKGVGLEVFWPHVVVIGVLGIVLTGVTLLAFRRALGD
ncbi:MAG TPA: ABC transporter permease [Chloroflexi bacterium]|nr:ABC transporter permease [Chloroflexota bacterium]